jgi:hypothetical protein
MGSQVESICGTSRGNLRVSGIGECAFEEWGLSRPLSGRKTNRDSEPLVSIYRAVVCDLSQRLPDWMAFQAGASKMVTKRP